MSWIGWVIIALLAGNQEGIMSWIGWVIIALLAGNVLFFGALGAAFFIGERRRNK